MLARAGEVGRAGPAIRWLGGIGAVIPLLALVLVLVVLVIEAMGAIRLNGLHFFTATEWNPGNTYGETVVTDGVAHPVGAYYGALPLIVGTLATSAIALIIAVPVSVGAALVIVERLPKRLAEAVGIVLELLAGIPSVVVGLWGAMTFGPFIAHHIAPVIAHNAPDVPVLNYLRGDPGNGEGMLVSGLVLAVMVVPIIATTTHDLFRQVPVLPREGAIALGMSNWECVRRVTLPWVSSGIVDALWWAACVCCLAVVITPTLWMLIGVVSRAVPVFHWSVLVQDSQGNGGGLRNAIIGTAVLAIGVILVGGTVSVLTGIYLSEFATGKTRSILRGAYEVLSGIPSIVLGYVGYLALVVYFDWGFSLAAGVLVLSVMSIPYIAKATESALAQVPTSYREAAEALGLPAGWALRKIVLKTAMPGIVTGMLVALALAIGETAPLLYTAGWSNSPPTGQLTDSPVGYLTYPIWTFYNQPSKSAQDLSYDAALLLIVFLLLLIFIGRLINWLSRRRWDV